MVVPNLINWKTLEKNHIEIYPFEPKFPNPNCFANIWIIPKDPKYKCKLKYKITSLLEPFCVQILWLWTRSLVDALDPWMEWNFFQKSEIPWPKKLIKKTCIFLLSCHYRGGSVLENWCHFRKKCHLIKIGTKQVLRGPTWNSWVVFLRGIFPILSNLPINLE